MPKQQHTLPIIHHCNWSLEGPGDTKVVKNHEKKYFSLTISLIFCRHTLHTPPYLRNKNQLIPAGQADVGESLNFSIAKILLFEAVQPL